MDKILEQLKNAWFILVFIGAVLIWYANTNARLTAVEAKQQADEVTLSQVGELQIDIAVIKTNVEYIKEKVK